MATFTDGETIEMNENKCYTFEVNNKLQWKKATRKQIKQSIKNI
jgi:ribosomal protein L23